MARARVNRSRLFGLWFGLVLARSGLLLNVLFLLHWLLIWWLILLVWWAFTGHYRMMRLFGGSLWQYNYSAALSWDVTAFSWWGSWSWSFHACFSRSWAFLLLCVLRGEAWAFALGYFALWSFLYWYTSWLFLYFGLLSWCLRPAWLFSWWCWLWRFWLTFVASCW